MNDRPKLRLIYQLFGLKAVLLPVEPGTKQCLREEWQHTTWEAIQEKGYQRQLANGGIAVLFGPWNLADRPHDSRSGRFTRKIKLATV